MSTIEEVYEKYEHLDKCLSDPEWCTSGEGAAIYAIAGELWRAVKEARSDGIPWCLCHEFDNNSACKSCSVRSICKQRTDVIAAQATAAENKRAMEILDKFYDNIKVAHRHDTSNYSEGLLDGIDLSITEIKNKSLRLAQPEPKERDPE